MWKKQTNIWSTQLPLKLVEAALDNAKCRSTYGNRMTPYASQEHLHTEILILSVKEHNDMLTNNICSAATNRFTHVMKLLNQLPCLEIHIYKKKYTSKYTNEIMQLTRSDTIAVTNRNLSTPVSLYF